MSFWPKGQPITLQEAQGRPLAFVWQGYLHTITRHNARWRVESYWWTGRAVSRDYWEVVTDAGLWCVIYHDRAADVWRLERVYE